MAAGGEFHWPVRVYYEDTDAAGVVYYANYLRFMERARTEWLRALGFEQDRLRRADGVVFVVARAALDFRRPGRLNDLLDVGVRITGVRRARLELSQDVTRPADGTLLCRAEVRVVSVDAESLKPRPIPGRILREIEIEH